MRPFIKWILSSILICCLLLSTGSIVLADGANTQEYAIVANPDSADRLNVREAPDFNATSIAKLYNGTFVRILSRNGSWAYVKVGNDEYGDGVILGYVHTDFLNTNIKTKSSDISTPVLRIENVHGTGINMRQNPSNDAVVLGLFQNGDQITVLAVLKDWYFVQVGGRTGYMSKIGFSIDLTDCRSASHGNDWFQPVAKLTTGAGRIAESTDVYSGWHDGKKLTRLEKGESVAIIGLYDTGWASINYPGNSEGGWVLQSTLSSLGGGTVSLGRASVAEQTNVLSDMYKGTVLTTLAQGETVTICTMIDNGWAKITYTGNDEGGWVQASVLMQ